jgi:tRNA threonylcarbamoyladenosine dehydratase
MESMFSRNIGLITTSQQDRLHDSTVAITGVGGVGGLLAERLIRLGIGKLRITDPGTFEQSNLNRQFGSSVLNLGHNKAETVFTQLKDINPHARISFNKDGITNENDANLLVQGCEVIVDEMDFGLFRESIYLQRAARRNGIYYMFTSAMGFGALLVIFSPDGMTLEEYNKIPRDVNLKDIETLNVPLERIAPVIPSYVSLMSEDTIQKIATGKSPAPTTSIGAGLASIMAANEVLNILLKSREINCAPQYIYLDLPDRRFFIGAVT